MFDNIHIATILVSYVAILFALSVHEAAHAAAAYYLEDDTAARLGRMTLNPLAHIDPLGTLILPLLGMISGIRVLGWAKPVPVNPGRLTRKYPMRVGYAMVAAAGPASNMVQSLVFLVILAVLIRVVGPENPSIRLNWFFASMQIPVERFMQVPGMGTGTALAITLLGRLVWINIGLAIFNLLPFGPLDGAGILRGFLPHHTLPTFDRIQPTITIVLLVCFLVLPVVITTILSPFFYVADVLYITPLARLLLGA
ncbi:site-2 protease family protein [Geothrix sp. 21YS21S-2]|uniref:site-2 protease family protein n=1 Tax=Geothrix sp. 21YS21S-2 TaxID=3068893 RepID=UPI0027BB0602|nr:site-2 protease family protein [Geothrix sp. 21YS21S-2]